MSRTSWRIPKNLLILTVAVIAGPVDASAPARQTVTVREEVYSVAPIRSGSMPLSMDLYLPDGPIRGAVVLAHGGAFTTGARDLQENKEYGDALAARGFLAAAISYRLHKDAPVVDGWATRYREVVRRHPFPRLPEMVARYGPEYFDAVAASAVDVAAAVAWLRAHAGRFGFDPDSIALFGASAGGISSLTVAHAMDDYGVRPPGVAAVIALRALLIRPDPAANPIRPGDPPVMILHGEMDERVPPEYAESLFASARDAGIAVEYISSPDRGHELGGGALLTRRTADGTTVLERIERFLASAFARTLHSGQQIRDRLTPAPRRGSGEGTPF